jgi:hypothetical protein
MFSSASKVSICYEEFIIATSPFLGRTRIEAGALVLPPWPWSAVRVML